MIPEKFCTEAEKGEIEGKIDHEGHHPGPRHMMHPEEEAKEKKESCEGGEPEGFPEIFLFKREEKRHKGEVGEKFEVNGRKGRDEKKG